MPAKHATKPDLPENARQIPNTKCYAATSDGRILSCSGFESYTCWYRDWHEVKQHTLKGKPYRYSTVKFGEIRRLSPVHRLVLLAFEGYPEDKDMQACHNDGDPSNNCIDNLRWDTVTENIRDKYRHGTMTRGEVVNTAKLTCNDVLTIRSLYDSGRTRNSLAKQFGVAFNTIHSIVTRSSWAHIP